MSYFAKYHQSPHQHSRTTTHTQPPPKTLTTHPFKKNTNETRQSYIKAFKKYYIDKIIQGKASNIQNQNQNFSNTKELFSFNHTKSDLHHCSEFIDNKPSKSIMKEQDKQKLSACHQIMHNYNERDIAKRISRSKITNLVKNNDSELEELLYNSISQVEQQMLENGDLNDITRQNKILKITISKLKLILKEKLEISLKKNKEELTIMFDEYSAMIKKLLEDKEQLTTQLQDYKQRLSHEENQLSHLESEYEHKINIIVEENNAQINNTKQQIEEFLDMIIQYQEEANKEKTQLEKLREKVIDLEMENDKLRQSSLEEQQKGTQPLDNYCHQIEHLLTIIEQLQQDNEELHLFLKNCKCSRIQSKNSSSQSLTGSKQSEDMTKSYEKQLVEAEMQVIKEQMFNRGVLKKKDECIERLNLLIDELRRNRYESVDKMTDEAMLKNSNPSTQ